MTIQWTFLPCLVQICFVVSEKKMKMWNSHRVQCKTKSSHGGHLEFPIGKWFTNLVQDHPMIIPAKSQFNWLRGFWQENFLNFSQWEHIMDPGSHVGFQISTKNTNLVEDHPMNISGKLSWNLFSGFREEDLNVKS
jgi:hypothetical protein